jgi:hypothetical protein
MERPHFRRVVGMILLIRCSLRGKVIVRRGILLLANLRIWGVFEQYLLTNRFTKQAISANIYCDTWI